MRSVSTDIVEGTILGGAIGDVLGGIAERGCRTLSDDTQLTLATCEAIIATGYADPHEIAQRMLDWFAAGRVSGIGSSTLKAMRDLQAGAHWALAGARGERAAGNGAAMRAAPLAFVLNPAVQRDRTTIRDVARITHHNDEAYVGALAVVLAIRAASRGELSLDVVASGLPDSRVRDYLLRVSIRTAHPPAVIAGEVGSSGFAPETVAVALTLALRIIEHGFEAAIGELNEIGGDTDTIGSIAGQVAGARIGATGLPQYLLNDVPSIEDVFRLARSFATAVTSG